MATSHTSVLVEPLPRPKHEGQLSVEEVLGRRRSQRSFSRVPLTRTQVAQLLWSAQGISDAEGHRTAPSAGALYPLETYLLAGRVSDLEPGIYRYRPASHDLLAVHHGDPMPGLTRCTPGQEWIGQAAVAVVLAAVLERCAVKYGARASGFVLMEVGHAAENLMLQAVGLHLGSTMVAAFEEKSLARLLKLPEDQLPFCILPVGRLL